MQSQAQKGKIITVKGIEYSVISTLGQGAYGLVLKVADKSNNHYALKVQQQQDDNEVQIMKKLKNVRQHRNIVNFITSEQFQNDCYIIMEFCDTDLFQQLQKKLIPQRDIRFIMVSIADGLQHLHENGIIHRDLKPENVFVKYLNVSGSKEIQHIYKLGDFGLSTQKAITQTQCIGTPYYMAPEIIQGKQYDSSVDIWALGTIIYELVMGQPLFNGGSVEEIQQQILTLTDDSQIVRDKLQIISDEYQNLVKQMIKIKPEERPPIKEVIRKLRINGYNSPPRVKQYQLPKQVGIASTTLNVKGSNDWSHWQKAGEQNKSVIAQITQGQSQIKGYDKNEDQKNNVKLNQFTINNVSKVVQPQNNNLDGSQTARYQYEQNHNLKAAQIKEEKRQLTPEQNQSSIPQPIQQKQLNSTRFHSPQNQSLFIKPMADCKIEHKQQMNQTVQISLPQQQQSNANPQFQPNFPNTTQQNIKGQQNNQPKFYPNITAMNQQQKINNNPKK